MAGRSPQERAQLLLQEFKHALEAEAQAREKMRANPGDPHLVRVWLRAMDATHEASHRFLQETRGE